jgi:hypothetical protein
MPSDATDGERSAGLPKVDGLNCLDLILGTCCFTSVVSWSGSLCLLSRACLGKLTILLLGAGRNLTAPRNEFPLSVPPCEGGSGGGYIRGPYLLRPSPLPFKLPLK